MNCPGCDTPIPAGSNKCPMCGAVCESSSATVQVLKLQPAIIQHVTEHHHHNQYSQPDKPGLIEQTSKKWKKLYLWAWLFFFLGFISCIGAAGGEPSMRPFAGFFLLGGFILYIRARAGAWWNHG